MTTPKLLDQVCDAIRVRRYSRRTKDSYVHWIRRFILFHDKRHPLEMAEREITAFRLTWLLPRMSLPSLKIKRFPLFYSCIRSWSGRDDVARVKHSERLRDEEPGKVGYACASAPYVED